MLTFDGGPEVRTAARHPIVGADRVARFLTFVMNRLDDHGRVVVSTLNGGTGALVYARDDLIGAVFVEPSEDGRAAEIRVGAQSGEARRPLLKGCDAVVPRRGRSTNPESPSGRSYARTRSSLRQQRPTNHPALLPLYDWFSRNLLLAEAGSRPWRQALTTEMLGDPSKHREQVLALLQAADLGVVDAKKHEPDPVMRERLRRAVRILSGIEDEPDGEDGPTFEELGIRLTHRGADGDVELDADDESLGTRISFGVIGPVVAALDQGSVFLADELDSSLHPALGAELVRLFQDPTTNPRRAQLIFNSHDVSLLQRHGRRSTPGRPDIGSQRSETMGRPGSTLSATWNRASRKPSASGTSMAGTERLRSCLTKSSQLSPT